MQEVKDNHNLITRFCQQCGKIFRPKTSNVAKGYGKFCSHECYANSLRGVPGPTRLRRGAEQTCEICSKAFYIRPNRIKNGPRFCSHACQGIAYKRDTNCICQTCGKPFHESPRTLKIGKGLFCSKECYLKSLPSRIQKDCEVCGQQFLIKPSRNRRALARVCSWHCWSILKSTDAERQVTSSRSIALWQDPEYIAKMMASHANRPTKPEKHLIEICNKHFPEFRYNGDFSLGITIGGMIPDFVNVNGKKQILEVFGDYWHNRANMKWHQTELGRTMAYNSVGYKTLVLWEHDLKEKSEDEIVNMVKVFTGGRK